jgi:septal ring factor EnvC (AmiA/AmiB activator)
MMTIGRRTNFARIRLRLAAAAALATLIAAAFALTSSSTEPARAAGISQLSSQLDQEHARQQSLATSLARLGRAIGSLDSQISLVESREAAVRRELASDRATLGKDKLALARERVIVAKLRALLARARVILSKQLVSSYEGDRPDLVSVVLDSRGFSDLLNQLNFLNRAEQEQKSTIVATRRAKEQADSAASRLAKLEAAEVQVTEAAAVRERALVGMNTLLHAKQAALARAQAAQQSALAASRARAGRLQSKIARIQAAQAAAQRAAAAAAAAASASAPAAGGGGGGGGGSSVGAPVGPTLGPSGGWAIPYAIVLCESGGQGLPPNSAGASGYYQILPSTWKLFGGTGPAAYLASKAEQDAVASRIWNGGAGASNWVCAGIVGIH